MQNLIILVGNIGNGKTTLAKLYIKKGYVVVSRDGIRQMFAAGGYMFNFDTEPLALKIERYALLALLQEGFNVLVDETNTTIKARGRLISVGQEYDYNIVAHEVYRLTKRESVKRRMEGDARGYTREKWAEIWERFDKQYQEPIFKEGFHEIRQEQAKGSSLLIQKDPGSKERRSRD